MDFVNFWAFMPDNVFFFWLQKASGTYLLEGDTYFLWLGKKSDSKVKVGVKEVEFDRMESLEWPLSWRDILP